VTTYREIIGKKIKKVSSDPSDGLDGEMWYNSTTGTLRGLAIIEAWISGANTLTSKQVPGGCGTQTAGLTTGGATNPPASALATTEEFNGSGWTAGGTLNTARWSTKLIGTQTAAVYSGKGSPATPYTGATELYNGTAWTANPNSANDTYNYRSGCGISTAALLAGGNYPPTNRAAGVEEFNGTSFSEGGELPQKQSSAGQAGTQTAAINSFGATNSPVPGNSGDADNAISLEYNGTAWTAGPNGNGVVPLSGEQMGAGTQTDAIFAGGPPTNSCKYDGTTFTVGPALATAQPGGAQSSGPAGAGWLAHGAPVPSVGNSTQEFNSSTNTFTAGAWAAGGAMGTAGYNISGVGPHTAGLGFARYTAPAKNNGYTEEYNGSTWSEQGDLSTGRMDAAGFGTQTAAVCAGGKQDPGSSVDNTEEYGGASWTAGEALPGTRRGAAGVGILTAGVVAGGTAPGLTDTTLEYDGTDYSSGGTLATARSGARGSGILAAGLIFGGNEPAASDNTEEYNGTAWTAGGDMIAATSAFGGSSAGTQSSSMAFQGNPNLATTTGYDGTAWSTRPSLGTGRMKGGGFGRGTLAVTFGGTTGPTTGTTATENFTGETSAANYKTITTS